MDKCLSGACPTSLDRNVYCTFNLALSSVEGRHSIGSPGRSADSGAVDGSDTEVVGVSQGQTMNRVFADVDGSVVALDPLSGANFTSDEHNNS